MKITVAPTGEISVETNGSNPADVAALLREIQRPATPDRSDDTPVSLNDMQGALYDWLVTHDAPMGIHTAAVAKHFGISNGAARHRLYKLVEMGLAKSVGLTPRAGLYRAVVE